MGACGLESGDVALAAIPRKMTIGIAQTLLLVIEWRIAMPKRTTGDRPELETVSVGRPGRFHAIRNSNLPSASAALFYADLHGDPLDHGFAAGAKNLTCC
jgi:hypothetical protein